MILKVLCEHAKEAKLAESMEVKDRLVHLRLNLDPDGSVDAAAPWTSLTRIVVSKNKTKGEKSELGRPTPMPEFPGVNNGGKAYFLADLSDKVLGVNGLTGEPLPDDPKAGGNPTKGFLHFWQRIEDAFAATKHPDLATLLAFRSRYLATEEMRREMPFVGFVPTGKDGKPAFCALNIGDPTPLGSRTITFAIGINDGLVFRRGEALHDYWKVAFNRERFAEAPAEGVAATNLGICLVSGLVDQPIADVHRTLIKGVPGLPPIGGYLVSFDNASPAFRSYGFDGGWNASISESVAAAYALGLNDLLANEQYRRRVGGSVLCAWVDYESELSGEMNSLFDRPDQADVEKFFDGFAVQGKYHHALDARRFHSATFAANGGRIVVRRWLDQPLGEVVGSIKAWFSDLRVDEILPPPRKADKGVKKSPGEESNAPHPLSMYALAATTARVPSEVQDGVRDSLYRAALERDGPTSLLPSVLQRLRIAATESGNGIRFQTSRFALIKLILMRYPSQPGSEPSMTIEPQLCVTDDRAYNCGRLLAVLDDLQEAAQGQVGAGVVARFYGNASTFPRNAFPRLIRLAKHHAGKLGKSADKKGRGHALERKLNDVCALFPATSPGGPPDFPQLLSLQEQGRFALGFHQQKASDDRDRQKFFADRAQKQGNSDFSDPVSQ
jgi:CRISPR-associated protein Csd1